MLSTDSSRLRFGGTRYEFCVCGSRFLEKSNTVLGQFLVNDKSTNYDDLCQTKKTQAPVDNLIMDDIAQRGKISLDRRSGVNCFG